MAGSKDKPGEIVENGIEPRFVGLRMECEEEWSYIKMNVSQMTRIITDYFCVICETREK